MKPAWSISSMVFQTSARCNMNCSYCYVPARQRGDIISAEVVRASLSFIDTYMPMDEKAELVWHGAEPLTAGIARFTQLVECAETFTSREVKHSIQTNGTLITEKWAELFAKHEFTVGVSLDGPRWANESRRDWSGKETHAQAVRGLERLGDKNIRASIIAVIEAHEIDIVLARSDEYFDFMSSLPISSLAFNFEEHEGANESPGVPPQKAAQLIGCAATYRERTGWDIHLRDFDRAAKYIRAGDQKTEHVTDLFPTTSFNGDVYFLSPELVEASSQRYKGFVAGSVLRDSPQVIVESFLSSTMWRDYVVGSDLCKRSCAYYGFCRGGCASNKFFEHGSLATTETAFCRSARQAPLDAAADHLLASLGKTP